MKTHSCALILVISACSVLHAQKKLQLNDSLRAKLHKDSLHIFRKNLAKPFLRIENRNSFIISEAVDFYGGMLGATFFDRHTIAGGYYFLKADSREPAPLPGTNSSQALQKLYYYNFTYQLVVINRRFIQVNLPLEVGTGKYEATLSDNTSRETIRSEGRFTPLSTGLQAIFKINRWLGISGLGGYRFVRHNSNLLRFNGYYFSFGVWVDARHLLRRYRYHLRAKKYQKMQRSLTAGTAEGGN